MLQFLLALGALGGPAAAAESDEWVNHVVKKALVRHYDPLHHDLVLIVESQLLTLHTERATVYGQLREGRLVDVTYESETYRAGSVTVRPDRLKSLYKP
jgi:hypothetical protein